MSTFTTPPQRRAGDDPPPRRCHDAAQLVPLTALGLLTLAAVVGLRAFGGQLPPLAAFAVAGVAGLGLALLLTSMYGWLRGRGCTPRAGIRPEQLRRPVGAGPEALGSPTLAERLCALLSRLAVDCRRNLSLTDQPLESRGVTAPSEEDKAVSKATDWILAPVGRVQTPIQDQIPQADGDIPDSNVE